MATPATNFTADNFRRVKVLYDYVYHDDVDKSKVWMDVGEIFYLLNSDQAEWWQVCRPDSPECPFYVPSTYVEVLSDVSGTSHQGHIRNNIDIQTHSILNDTVRKNRMSTFKGTDSDDEGSDYINAPAKIESDNSGSKDIKVQYISSSENRPSNLVEEDDYVNLEQFREAAGISSVSAESHTPPSPKTPETDSDIYANLQQLDISEPNTPEIEQCEFLKTLQDMWDVYREPVSNRLFYVNTKSNETQWKPPRGQFHEELHKKRSRSSGEYEEVTLPTSLTNSRGNRKSRSVDYGKPLIMIETNVPEGWSFSVKDSGEDVFIDNATKQEWYRARDTYGRSYYYRQSKEVMHSVWQLPRSGGSSPAKSPSSDSEGKTDFPSPVQGLVQGPRPGDRSQVSDRFAKSRSVMIENLHFNAPPVNTGPPPPKSATFPSNFTAPIHEDLSVDGKGSGKSQSNSNHHQQTVFQSVNINEPIEGWLNKCRFTNGKKPSKKWAMTYVKLGGSNLVFYKDQKSSHPKPGLPHGKYEQLVSLATCKVDRDTEKYTSKKYTIGINCTDCQILLQANDEMDMQEWFMKIHTRIHEMGGRSDAEDTGLTNTNALMPETDKVNRKSSFKDKNHSRKQSDSGTLERKGKIKNVLERFMTNRSDKEKLIKKGIYKDAVFGADIKQLCAKEKTKVPMFVVQSIDAIEKRGLEHEGIYRVGGNISQIQKLRCIVDQGEQYILDDPMWDVNVLTGALKLFFRELKDPLFTFALFDKFLKHFLSEKATERLKGMKATIEELPKPHYDTVKQLFKHLTKVIEQSKENKMAAHQLAIVFGPTLIWPEIQHQNLATSMVYQSRIVEFVLLEYKNIFR